MQTPRVLAGLLLCIAACCTLFIGCGTKGPATSTIDGKITYNSQPVTAGMVVYENISKGWIGAAELDSEGRYRISNIRVGDYTVSIQPPIPKTPNENDSSIEEIKAKLATNRPPDPKNIPRPVRNTQTSPLKVSVAGGEQEFSFELSKAAGS